MGWACPNPPGAPWLVFAQREIVRNRLLPGRFLNSSGTSRELMGPGTSRNPACHPKSCRCPSWRDPSRNGQTLCCCLYQFVFLMPPRLFPDPSFAEPAQSLVPADLPYFGRSKGSRGLSQAGHSLPMPPFVMAHRKQGVSQNPACLQAGNAAGCPGLFPAKGCQPLLPALNRSQLPGEKTLGYWIN